MYRDFIKRCGNWVFFGTADITIHNVLGSYGCHICHSVYLESYSAALTHLFGRHGINITYCIIIISVLQWPNLRFGFVLAVCQSYARKVSKLQMQQPFIKLERLKGNGKDESEGPEESRLMLHSDMSDPDSAKPNSKGEIKDANVDTDIIMGF